MKYSNETRMKSNSQQEIILLSSNWLPGMLLLIILPKKLLLGNWIGADCERSQNEVEMYKANDL